jgi:hypothetical protein
MLPIQAIHTSTHGIYFGRGNLAKNLRNSLLKTTNFITDVIGLPLEKYDVQHNIFPKKVAEFLILTHSAGVPHPP